MTSLDLKRNNLTRIKIGFFASFNKLADLTLDNNMISRVTKTRMRGLFNLKELSLADNQIRAIKCDTFDESPKLNVLNLGRNQLSALPCIRSPPGNWSLRTLILAGNNLTDGHNASVAAYLKNVRTLDISNNNLKELTNFTTEMPSLQLLWLNGNSHLRFDPTDFANSENLTWVKYADSNLQRAPLFGKAKSSMDYLDLGKNNIKCIDIDHISNMQNVTLLNFTENNLNMFPDIGCLTTLSSSNINDITFPRLGEIILTHNQIYQFPLLPGMPLESIIRLQHNELIEFPPERLALLTKVGILQMQYNNATQFPDFSYASTYSMTDLDLSHNNISSVPSGNIAPLVSLTHLRLQYNYISDLPIMEFAHNTLKYLYLSHNLIHQLDPMILPPKTLLALTHLYVSYNFISQVPKALFGQLHSLIYLDISYNILETMPCVSGVGPTLQTLLLRHNNLTHVPAKCVEGLSGLEKLDLSYNLIVDFPFWMMVDGYFPSLIKLNISSNLISHIPSLDSQKILQTLRMDVTSNYLNCTHRLCWLKSFQRFTLNRDDKLCAFPPRFAGLAFADISDVDLGCHCEYSTQSLKWKWLHFDETGNCHFVKMNIYSFRCRSDITWAWWGIISPVTWLFVQQRVLKNYDIKLPLNYLQMSLGIRVCVLPTKIDIVSRSDIF